MPGLRWTAVVALIMAAGRGLAAGDAADTETLPNPLTLDYALSLADAPHPDLLAAEADQEAALAELLQAESATGTYAAAVGKLRAVEPSHRSLDPSSNDSQAQLVVRKRLYDFGLSRSRREAAQQRIAGAEAGRLDARQRRRLEIMQRYFDVLLADLAYVRENEALATAFVAVDKARDRNELGQLSDVDLLELESAYQDVRARWAASANDQRATRARLAIALNRPADLPADLEMPPQPEWPEELPEFEPLWAKVRASSPLLAAQRARERAAEQSLRAAEASDNPTLSGEAEAGIYNRLTGSTHPLAVGLVLEIPLYQGGESRARVAAARAELSARRAERAQTEHRLRQSLLELWLELGELKIRRDQIRAQDDFRGLYLDRSRALYELEVKTDLGDAMTETSAVRYRQAEVQLRWLMAQAELRAMSGELIAGEGGADPSGSLDSGHGPAPSSQEGNEK